MNYSDQEMETKKRKSEYMIAKKEDAKVPRQMVWLIVYMDRIINEQGNCPLTILFEILKNCKNLIISPHIYNGINFHPFKGD